MTVTAENGDSRTITFKITRKQDPNYVADKDATLRTLIPSSGVLSPSFLSTQKSYILYIENAVTSVSFEATAKSDKAIGITGLGEQEIKDDISEIKITCTAENGDTATYVITVVRLPEYSGKVPEFTFPSDDPVPPPDDPGNPDPPSDPNNDDPNNEPSTGNTEKPKKPSKAVVVIIIAASICAVISLTGIIILLTMNRKNKRK